MKPFEYASAGTLEEAVDAIGQGSVALAGGTDLLTMIKADLQTPERLVNIKNLPSMSGLDYDEAAGLRIGALVKLADLENSSVVRQKYPAVVEALGVAATPQLRNMATVGGNLLQRPRCWYFRDRHIDCWLKGGDDCRMEHGENRFAAVFRQSPCLAVHPSDLAPVLLALDARVRVYGPSGERELAFSDLYRPPQEDRRTETTLGADDLITEVIVPPVAAGVHMTYVKAMDRKIWAFALVGVAMVVQMSGETVSSARIVLSGVANTPIRAPAAEEVLTGNRLDGPTASRAAAAAFAEATPLSQNAYKLRIGRALTARSLESLSHNR